MRLEQLEYLIEIHKTHSINLASQNLHVSQQNISQSIQKLEAELGLSLLERSSQGTYLTDAGMTALKHAQKIFYELSTMQDDMKLHQKQNPPLHGDLRIMYTHGFDVDQIYHSLSAFADDYPHVKISVHQKSLARLLSAVYDQEIDIGLISATGDFHLNYSIEQEKLKALSVHPLSEDTLLAAVSHLSPLAKQKSITISKLLQNQLIFLQQESADATTANWLFHYLSNYGTPQFRYTTNAFELYVKAIADDGGIGFFTPSTRNLLGSLMKEAIVLLPIRPAIPLFYSYVLHATRPLSKIAEAYLPYLIK